MKSLFKIERHHLLVSVLFFIPVLFLAYNAQWDYDEAWTWFGIQHSTYKDIAIYKQFKLANNHVLNSIYFHWVQGLGARAEIFYRLLSLLSYPLYCTFIYRLLRRAGMQSGNLSYLVLYLLPYAGYFSIGRGYALALAFFAASLYYYKAFTGSYKTGDLLRFIFTGSIASISLFSFLFPFMAMLILIAGNVRHSLKPLNIFALLLSLPAILYVFFMGRIVNAYDPCIVGGDSLLRNGSVSSIISYMALYETVSLRMFFIFKVALCASMLPAAIIMIKRRALHAEHVIALITLLLLVCSHFLFGSKYPMYRGLVYIILLMYLPFVYANTRQHILLTAHLLVVGIIGAVNLGIMLNNSTRHTTYDALVYMARMRKPLYVDDVNPNIKLYSHLYFGDSLQIVQYEMDEPEIAKSFHAALDTACYVLSKPGEIAQNRTAINFMEKFSLPEHNFYVRK